VNRRGRRRMRLPQFPCLTPRTKRLAVLIHRAVLAIHHWLATSALANAVAAVEAPVDARVSHAESAGLAGFVRAVAGDVAGRGEVDGVVEAGHGYLLGLPRLKGNRLAMRRSSRLMSSLMRRTR